MISLAGYDRGFATEDRSKIGNACYWKNSCESQCDLYIVEDVQHPKRAQVTKKEVIKDDLYILFFSSPSKVQQKFLEALRKEDGIFLSILPSEFVNAVTGQSMHRWIDVTERELISRNLSVWRHICLAKEQDQLILCEFGIHFTQRKHVEC